MAEDLAILMSMITSLQRTIELLTARLEKYENVEKTRALVSAEIRDLNWIRLQEVNKPSTNVKQYFYLD